ncbi:MAG: acetyl-CoA C-acetyltransferase [Candidatus Hydrogenedentota bacterium]
MRDIILIGSARTPIGTMGGVFANTGAVQLGAAAASATIERAGATPEQVQEVIFGNVLQAGQGQNPARQVAIHSGVPLEVPSFSVNKVCGSGMKAIDLAWQSVLLERADCILAGGTENMTLCPYYLPAMRAGARMGNVQAIDGMVHDGLWDIFNDFHMGITAENVVEQYGLTREEQDQFAIASQEKCGAAMNAGRFNDEIVPITVKQRKGETVVDTDEHPKPGSTLEKIAGLRPAFKKDGSVTAANASGINDGAASVLVVGEDAAKSFDTSSAVYLRDVRSCGCDPRTMGLGPIGPVRLLLEKNGLTKDDIDLFELNEAFAAQSLAVIRDLGLDMANINVNGGAIALGHPIGCSGARILTTLIHELKKRGGRYGIAAMCIGGGMGIGCLVENKQ